MGTALTQLVAELKHTEVARRLAAAEAIAQSADTAQQAAVAVIHAVADSDDQVRQWATSALEDLGPPRAEDASALAGLLTNPNGDIAYWAATLLGRLGGAASATRTALQTAAEKHPAETARARARWALGKIA